MQKNRQTEIFKLAKKTLRTYKLHDYPTDPIAFAKRLGLRIRPYQSLTPFAKQMYDVTDKPAVTVHEDDSTIIYYNIDVPEFPMHIMHEIAHWLLFHQEDTPDKEEEADALAYYLMYPVTTITENKRRWLGIATIICVACLAFFTGFNVYPKIFASSTPASAPANPAAINLPVPSNITTAEQQVYVTKTGAKYHLENCQYINNRETRSITISEAIKQGYGSCQSCIHYDS